MKLIQCILPIHVEFLKRRLNFNTNSSSNRAELTFKVMQLDCNFKWLIDEIVDGVKEALLPKGEAMFLFLDGVLLKEKARPTFNLVLVASLNAFDKVPKFTSWVSMPIS